MSNEEILFESKYLRMIRRDDWDFVQRKSVGGVVGIIAVTPEDKLVLVEQHRIPVQAATIELPAGLAGDTAAFAGEPLETAARRELLEETGWQADRMVKMAVGPSSAGMTDETVTLFRAEGLRKTGAGGGDEHENILVHEIPMAGLLDWLDERQARGTLVDFKVWAAIPLARHRHK